MLRLFAKPDKQVVINNGPPLVITQKETILNGALRQGIRLPYSCKVGGCGTCKCRLVEGKVREFTDKSYLLSKQDMQNNMILACQSAPRSNVVVEFVGWDHNIEDFDGHIAAITPLTHDIARIEIELDRPVSFRAGQYASIEALGTDIPARCYSFAHRCTPGGTQQVSFFVRAVESGRMSHWLLDEQHLNKPVRLTAPQGDFYLRDAAQPAIAVAGGSGLAPLMAVLEEAIATDAQMVHQPLQLLFGVRTQRDIYHQAHIAQLAQQWQAEFNFLPVLSAEPGNSDWQGARGFVTDYIDAATCANASAYLCGPPPMLDAAMASMTQAGMPAERIFFDKFSDQSGASF